MDAKLDDAPAPSPATDTSAARHLVATWVRATIADGAVRDVRVRLGAPAAAAGLTVAQVNLITGGHAVRVQAAAPTAREAGLRLIERLARLDVPESCIG